MSTAVAAVCLSVTAGALISVPPAAAAGATAMPVGAWPNATRLHFKVGDAVQG